MIDIFVVVFTAVMSVLAFWFGRHTGRREGVERGFSRCVKLIVTEDKEFAEHMEHLKTVFSKLKDLPGVELE